MAFRAYLRPTVPVPYNPTAPARPVLQRSQKGLVLLLVCLVLDVLVVLAVRAEYCVQSCKANLEFSELCFLP